MPYGTESESDYWMRIGAARAATAVPAQARPPRQPTPTPEADARAAGYAAARDDALAVIALCDRYGRPDMVPQLVGKTVAEAKQKLAASVWDSAFSEARIRVR